ncbi:hypothetical protein QUF80_19835 [Desulfococcaceae bacterium HSG8]|nr:hypothetical protein [Desulfococcaceae bacterium HSG8]
MKEKAVITLKASGLIAVHIWSVTMQSRFRNYGSDLSIRAEPKEDHAIRHASEVKVL